MTVMTLLTMNGLVAASGPSLGTTFFSVPPTARMHACGALAMLTTRCVLLAACAGAAGGNFAVALESAVAVVPAAR